MLLFVHSSLPIGGAEVLRYTVARELQRRKVDFQIVCIESLGELGIRLRAQGVPIIAMGLTNSIYSVTTTLRLTALFLKLKPSLVQSSQFNSNYHARLAAKLSAVKIVITEEHGIYHWKKWHHRMLDRFLDHWCDAILCVSERVRQFNIEVIGIEASKLMVLHNCIDMERLVVATPVIRSELSIAGDDFVFLHLGKMRAEKGHEVLLRALKKIGNARVKLILLGDGPLRQQLADLVTRLDLDEQVSFVGERSNVYDWLMAADAFVFPSVNEGLGIALLEAMYVGLPAVTSRTGGIVEIVQDNETALLVRPGDADDLAEKMQRLIREPDLRRFLGQRAREYVERNHTPATYVDRLLTSYQSLGATL